MGSAVRYLVRQSLISPPSWLVDNVHYETIMGSYAYGVSNSMSDVDVYGFCIPPKDMIFPHLRGEILGFGRQKKRFDQYQQHHVEVEKRSYDLSIYSIVRFFHLCMENNPNMVDALFVPRRCILHTTAVGELVREHRRDFLHKGSWPKFKGYAYSQLHRMSSQNRTGKRLETFLKYGFDVKFAYHVVRLLYEAEMILGERDLELDRHREHLKAIRRGEVKEHDIRAWASEKKKSLEKLYESSALPWGPDEAKVKALLLKCLEMHYGKLGDAVVAENQLLDAMREVRDAVDRVRGLI